MDNLTYIEAYCNKELSPEGKKEFEQRIVSDPVLAEEMAFYLSSREAAAAEMMKEKERFKIVYQQYKLGGRPGRQQGGMVRRLIPWAAVAAVLAGVIFSWNSIFTPASPHQLAEKYVQENFQTLSVTMGNNADSLQAALGLFNEGSLKEALQQFENLAVRDTASVEAKKYAGIVSLRLAQYDKAIHYFSQLENDTRLYVNPGKFFHALTLLKRNSPDDKEAARMLLDQVVQNDLEGKATAQDWLKKW